MSAGPRPGHRFEADAAIRAAQQPQLALDHATSRADIQVTPALHAAIVDLQMPSGLTADRADPAPAGEPDRHDHPLAGKADIDDGCSGQAEQPLECRRDAHVALPCEPLAIDSQQPAPRAAARRPRSAQPPRTSSASDPAANQRQTRLFTPPLHPQSDRRPQEGRCFADSSVSPRDRRCLAHTPLALVLWQVTHRRRAGGVHRTGRPSPAGTYRGAAAPEHPRGPPPPR